MSLVHIQHSKTANFRYAVGFDAECSYYVYSNEFAFVLVSDMEKERAKSEVNSGIEVISYSDLKCKKPDECLINFLKERKAKSVVLPEDFPIKTAMELQNFFSLKVERSPLEFKRSIKTAKEVEFIKESCIAAVNSFKFMIKILEKRNKKCEELRKLVELYLFSKGFLAENTIIASGKRTYQPHWIGYGEIDKHIIADIFPKNIESGYFGDFTRTIIVEECKDIEDMLKAVICAKSSAENIVKEGILASDIHEKVCETLESFGYKTDERGGFIHSTGHGVGLEIHEDPKISNNEDVIKSGMVFTIEPGLYYKDIGGVRVEDTILVRKNECEILTKCEDFIKIKCKK